MKKYLTKKMFLLGFIGAMLFILIKAIDSSELKWLFCYIGHENFWNSQNICENFLSFLLPIFLFMPISLMLTFFEFEKKTAKKRILIFSLAGICLLIGLFCSEKYLDSIWQYEEIMTFLSILSFLSIPIAPFSLITYKMHDDVFRRWWNFARVWILFCIFLILALPDADPMGARLLLMAMVTPYVLISLIIILRTWFKARKEGSVLGKS